jgi:hypothetical protein
MPKLIVYVSGNSERKASTVESVVDALRPVVAEAMSIPEVKLSADDVDVVTEIYNPFLFRFGQYVAVEIETFGYPERVAKLNEDAVLTLKSRIVDIFEAVGLKLDRNKPLLWIKYVDPRGYHV